MTQPTDEQMPDELLLKIQALTDNELPEEEIGPVLEAIQGSYEFRQQYAELLRLRKRLAGVVVKDPDPDWAVIAEKSISRRLFRGTGTVVFVASCLALLGVGLAALFRNPEVPLYLPVLAGAGLLGLLSLLVGAVRDRLRERKTDRYREVVR